MNPLLYLKAVIGAVGANVFPPIADWLVGFTMRRCVLRVVPVQTHRVHAKAPLFVLKTEQR